MDTLRGAMSFAILPKAKALEECPFERAKRSLASLREAQGQLRFSSVAAFLDTAEAVVVGRVWSTMEIWPFEVTAKIHAFLRTKNNSLVHHLELLGYVTRNGSFVYPRNEWITLETIRADNDVLDVDNLPIRVRNFLFATAVVSGEIRKREAKAGIQTKSRSGQRKRPRTARTTEEEGEEEETEVRKKKRPT